MTIRNAHAERSDLGAQGDLGAAEFDAITASSFFRPHAFHFQHSKKGMLPET